MLEVLELEWIIVDMWFYLTGIRTGQITIVPVSKAIVLASRRKLRLVSRVHRALCERNCALLNKDANFFVLQRYH